MDVGKLCTVDRRFPLYDLLHQQTPMDTDPDGEILAAGSNTAIDVQHISHFALGTFWKGSLHPWKYGEISLGPYQEPIRTWLWGEAAFPKNVALNVALSRPASAQIVMNPPYQTEHPSCHTYLFHVPGVLFRLSVGKNIRREEKTLCFYSSAEHFVVVSDIVTKKVAQTNAKYFHESTKTKSFEKARARQKKLAVNP